MLLQFWGSALSTAQLLSSAVTQGWGTSPGAHSHTLQACRVKRRSQAHVQRVIASMQQELN
jgi:hypothetical protein